MSNDTVPTSARLAELVQAVRDADAELERIYAARFHAGDAYRATERARIALADAYIAAVTPAERVWICTMGLSPALCQSDSPESTGCGWSQPEAKDDPNGTMPLVCKHAAPGDTSCTMHNLHCSHPKCLVEA